MKIYRLIAVGVAMLFAAPALADMTPVEQQETLTAHNNERALYPGVSSLRWSPELALIAQEWAQSLADRDAFEHRPNIQNNPFKPGEYLGENIFKSWGGTGAHGTRRRSDLDR
jgi:uncharacterized protein YkwD